MATAGALADQHHRKVELIADTAAHSAIAEALGRRVPVVAVPMVNEHLADNPAWTRNIAMLTAAGVTWVSMLDGTGGPVESVRSGSGEELTRAFDPEWVVEHLPPATSSHD